MINVIDEIRAEVDAMFTTPEFINYFVDRAYELRLKEEMHRLWDGADFVGAEQYRLYVLEKIKLSQRRRHHQDMANFEYYSGHGAAYESRLDELGRITIAEVKLAEKRLQLREKIGTISYD